MANRSTTAVQPTPAPTKAGGNSGLINDQTPLSGLLQQCILFADDVAAGRTGVQGDHAKTFKANVAALKTAAAAGKARTAADLMTLIEKDHGKSAVSLRAATDHSAQSRVTTLRALKLYLNAKAPRVDTNDPVTLTSGATSMSPRSAQTAASA